MLCVVFEEIFDDGECPTLREREREGVGGGC